MTQRPFLAAVASLALAGAAAFSPAPAHAQQGAVTLKGEVKLVRTVTSNGKTSETFEAPGQVVPGDRLLFATRYTNAGSQPATDFVVVNPLPQPIRLAAADGLEVSIDGGKTFGVLAALRKTDVDGTARPAALDDVTHVRWRLASISPGGSGELRYFGEVR